MAPVVVADKPVTECRPPVFAVLGAVFHANNPLVLKQTLDVVGGLGANVGWVIVGTRATQLTIGGDVVTRSVRVTLNLAKRDGSFGNIFTVRRARQNNGRQQVGVRVRGNRFLQRQVSGSAGHKLVEQVANVAVDYGVSQGLKPFTTSLVDELTESIVDSFL